MLSQPFFFVVTPKNGNFDVLFSRSYFTRLSNRFTAVGLFCCCFSTAVCPHCGENERVLRKFSIKFVCFQKVFNPGCRFSVREFLLYALEKWDSLLTSWKSYSRTAILRGSSSMIDSLLFHCLFKGRISVCLVSTIRLSGKSLECLWHGKR